MSLLLATSCFSQDVPALQQGSAASRSNLPVESWLAQGPRSEIPWKVTVTKRGPGYRLVDIVNIKVEMSAEALQKAGVQLNLEFIVKVVHENEAWDRASGYSTFRMAATRTSKLQMRAGMYLKPGAYTIATVLYDAASGKKSVSFHRLQIKDSKKGELSELLRGAPQVEFLGLPENPDPVGPEHLLLPVVTQHAIQFDLIVDLSTRDQAGDALELVPPNPDLGNGLPTSLPTSDSERRPTAPGPPTTRRRADTAKEQTWEQVRLQEIARLLAEMDFQPGCGRVTVLDVLRLRTLLPATAIHEVDWSKLRKENSIADKVVVDVTTLEGRRQADIFLKKEVAQTIAQPPQCSANFENPLHVIAILSHGIHFPSGSKKEKIDAQCNCKIFYFYKAGEDIAGLDDLKKMLGPLAPQVLEFGDPEKLRERVLEFVEAVKTAAQR